MRWTFHRKISLHLSCSRASFSVSTQMPNAKVKAEDSTPLFRYFASHPLRWVTNVRIPFSLWFYPPNLLVMDPGICINLLNRLLYIFVIFDTSPKGQSESKSIHIHSHIYMYWLDRIRSPKGQGAFFVSGQGQPEQPRREPCIRSISAEAKELLFVLRWKCANVPVILLNLMLERTVSFKVCWLVLGCNSRD